MKSESETSSQDAYMSGVLNAALGGVFLGPLGFLLGGVIGYAITQSEDKKDMEAKCKDSEDKLVQTWLRNRHEGEEELVVETTLGSCTRRRIFSYEEGDKPAPLNNFYTPPSIPSLLDHGKEKYSPLNTLSLPEFKKDQYGITGKQSGLTDFNPKIDNEWLKRYLS